MIGGYLYSERDPDFHARLQHSLDPNAACVEVWNQGYFFYTSPFQPDAKCCFSSHDVISVCEDLLVAAGTGGSYRLLDPASDIAAAFPAGPASAFDSIHSDFRMAVATNQGEERLLYLASNRAGSGRIYYHRLGAGIVFSSDLRFLLKVVPFEVSRKAIYSILKYGSAPEPLTICSRISAVPAAHYLRYNLADGRESIEPYFKYRFPADRQSGEFDESRSLEPVREVLRQSARFLGSGRPALLVSGGIDSSLFGCYLYADNSAGAPGYYCSFGHHDPDYPFAKAIADRLRISLQVAMMGKPEAMRALDDAVSLVDHPFSDFSTLPVVFMVGYINERQSPGSAIIECNGGDDCFGFPALLHEPKFRTKHSCPSPVKKVIARALVNSPCWKWEASEGTWARIAALADVHENSLANYFLVQAPVNYLSLDRPAEWDDELQQLIQRTASSCAEDYEALSYEARTTVRQLLYVNSARWAAKAFSAGESLGRRVVYPFIWRDVLLEQGKLPWSAKVRNGIVKWPLKKLLEEFMSKEFVYRPKSGFVPPFVRWLTDAEFNDRVVSVLSGRGAVVPEIIPGRILRELLADARAGKRLRAPILNTLWGALFTEAWIQAQKAH